MSLHPPSAKALMRAGEPNPGDDPELNRELDERQAGGGSAADHSYTSGGPGPSRNALEQALPVTIADGVWLAAAVLVCPGVTIGENTVVGAGAVVTRNLPAGVVLRQPGPRYSRDRRRRSPRSGFVARAEA